MIQTLSDALAERGYDTLTPVQEAVTDPALAQADLLVSAQTGSGKTVGFGIAIAPTILDETGTLPPAAAPLGLIIAPTRELAFQVTRELSWLYAKAGARVVSCVGGMDMRDERRALERGAHLVVATPGRLRDHIQRGSIDLSEIRAVVLDEADEMLDLGFREDLEFILSEAPEGRRTLMFSATVPPEIARLAETFQTDSQRLKVSAGAGQHADIEYQALAVAQQDAENAIINLLRFHDAQNAIVFANTRAAVARLTARFANRGFAVVSLSGELSQTERSHALQAMRDGRARVCVATDVAARGIDLPNLELVIHAEPPSNAEGLLHRSGRTGRAGRKGISAMIVPPRLRKKVERLLQWAKINATWGVPPSADDILARDEERLLSDPVWSEEIAESEAEFGQRLLEMHGPERIAAAYLRLYRANRSAPEELSAPDARPEKRERPAFGPSAWIALSVGRDARAEPRWLLPLLCREGGLSKDDIGAIRIQPTESFVEIAAGSIDGLFAKLGPSMKLEDKITVRPSAPPTDSPRPPRKPRPAETGGAAERPARPASAPDAAPAPKAAPKAAPKSAPKPAPKPAPRPAEAQERWTPPLDPVPAAERPAPRKERHKSGGPGTGTPRPERTGAAPRSWGKKSAAEGADGARPAPRGESRPGGKFEGKPSGKFAGKPGGKPAGAGRFGKPGGAPDRSEGGGFGKGPNAGPKGPRKPAAAASDTSQRFVPPGKKTGGKPGGKPGGGSGARPAGKGGPRAGKPGGGGLPPRRGKP